MNGQVTVKCVLCCAVWLLVVPCYGNEPLDQGAGETDLCVGAAAVNLQADDSMVIAGGIGDLTITLVAVHYACQDAKQCGPARQGFIHRIRLS